MKEPERLLVRGATAFERELLQAVARERPSRKLRSRMLYALGLTGPWLWLGKAKAATSAPLGKVALGAALGGAMLAGGLAVHGRRAQEPAERVIGGPPAATMADAVPAPREVAAPVPFQPPAATASPTSQLREEIALLDTARDAARRRDFAAALQALDAHRARFPSGVLRREADVLRAQLAAAASPPRPAPGQTSEPDSATAR